MNKSQKPKNIEKITNLKKLYFLIFDIRLGFIKINFSYMIKNY